MAEQVRPFLKWAGNKVQIVNRIKAVLPPGRRLIEPFVGSGAVFLNTEYAQYLLADRNPDLICLYCLLREEGEALIETCRAYFRPETNTPEVFYAYRARFNATDDPREKAVLFLYLNRHGYNGLCRYNSRGGFNVPFGRYRKPYFPETEMAIFHRRAQQATFLCADFDQTLAAAQAGDVVYCDPPYVPLSETANFTNYSADPFGRDEQLRLARRAEELAERGIPVVISNHDTGFTRQAYTQAQITAFDVRRSISCNGAKRARADELLAHFGVPSPAT